MFITKLEGYCKLIRFVCDLYRFIRMASSSNRFRQSFKISKDIINWYPGHMRNSIFHMQAKMRITDCVIEVHDARVPLTGRNSTFVKNLIGTKPHILVLSKMDLINASNFRKIEMKCKMENQDHVVLVNSLDQKCKGLKKIVPLAASLIRDSTPLPNTDNKFRILVIGIPNVGKSSLINALRNVNLHKGKATAVGAVAGITRSVQNDIKISENPPIYLIDTPGILLPNIENVEAGMKLALCSCLKDDVIGITNIADFLIFWMNKTNNFKYVDHFNIKEPIDSVLPLLVKIAVDLNKVKKMKNVALNTWNTVPDTYYAAQHLVKLFRTGVFGDIDLDEVAY